MARSLWEEFVEEKKRKRLIVGGVIGAALVLWLGIGYWPPATLNDAIKHINAEEQPRPYKRGQTFTGHPHWIWVDAERRADMEESFFRTQKGVVEVMLQTADGKPFLYHPFGRQAYINSAKGPVFVFNLGWEKYAAFARDAKGGPILDLTPYKTTPESAVVPLDVLAPYVTQKISRGLTYWSVYMITVPEGNIPRPEVTIHDPLAAVAFGSGKQ